MDIISFNEAATANGRVERFIENPDSNSGIITQPKVIEAGETVTIKSGRQAILADTVVAGDLVIEAGGDVFVPAGATFGDLENQINTKATKQETNITVNVGAGQTYTTINQALEYLSGFYPMYKKSGVTATINLKAGFVMAEQVLVSGIDLGWITIVGEDAETIITHTALTTNFTSSDYGFNSYPAFGVSKGGVLPRIGQLFNMNLGVSGASSGKHGVMAIGAGSSADVLSGKGVKNVGAYGIYASNGATINAYGANATGSGATGIYATQGSTIHAQGAIATGSGSIGIYASQGSTINAYGANASGAASNGIYANLSSTINAYGANASGAGLYGIAADYNSSIDAFEVILRNQTTGMNCIRVAYGSSVEAAGINTTGSTVTIFSQAVNTLTGNGIIYQ